MAWSSLIDEMIILIIAMIITIVGIKERRREGKFKEKYLNIIFILLSYLFLPLRYPGLDFRLRIFLSFLAGFASWFAGRFFDWFTRGR